MHLWIPIYYPGEMGIRGDSAGAPVGKKIRLTGKRRPGIINNDYFLIIIF